MSPRTVTIRHALLEGVTPEMLAWWYGHVPGTMEYAGGVYPRYLVWHPRDHISYEVLGRADDAVGSGTRLRIVEAPQRDVDRLIDLRVTVVEVSEVGAVNESRALGSNVVRVENAFEFASSGVRYVSRMKLGDETLAGRLLLNRIATQRVFPPGRLRAWVRHHVEEIGNLPNFLPDLFAAETHCRLARSVDPADRSAGPDGARDLGDFVDDVEQVPELFRSGGRPQLDRVGDAGRRPRVGVECADRVDAYAVELDSERGGLAVDVVEDASGCREMQQMCASEVGLHRHALRRPLMRKSHRVAVGGSQRPGRHHDSEALAHPSLLPLRLGRVVPSRRPDEPRTASLVPGPRGVMHQHGSATR